MAGAVPHGRAEVFKTSTASWPDARQVRLLCRSVQLFPAGVDCRSRPAGWAAERPAGRSRNYRAKVALPASSELCVSLVAQSVPRPGGEVRRRREGIQVRRARRCASRSGDECSCTPTFKRRSGQPGIASRSQDVPDRRRRTGPATGNTGRPSASSARQLTQTWHALSACSLCQRAGRWRRRR